MPSLYDHACRSLDMHALSRRSRLHMKMARKMLASEGHRRLHMAGILKSK